MKNLPLVSVIIPTHNRKEKLVALINSILESNYPKNKLEIIVVDDSSTDGTCDEIKKRFPNGIYDEVRKNFLGIKIIRNSRNLQLAGSRNIGIKHSNGEFVFLVDDDNVLDPSCIRSLVEFMKSDGQIAVAGPITYYLHRPKTILFCAVRRNLITGKTKFIGKDEEDNGQYFHPIESDDIPNAFMIRTGILKQVGLLDEKRFPIHHDEADFGIRVRKAGFKIRVLPNAKIYHDSPIVARETYNSLRTYYAVRNKIVFHSIHQRKVRFFVFLICFLPLFLVYYSIKSRLASICLIALFDALTGKDRGKILRSTKRKMVLHD
jgi:GT2 family glycosyltransferase